MTLGAQQWERNSSVSCTVGQAEKGMSQLRFGIFPSLCEETTCIHARNNLFQLGLCLAQKGNSNTEAKQEDPRIIPPSLTKTSAMLLPRSRIGDREMLRSSSALQINWGLCFRFLGSWAASGMICGFVVARLGAFEKRGAGKPNTQTCSLGFGKYMMIGCHDPHGT